MIYSIAHRPVHRVDAASAGGAARIVIRPMLPQDAGLQRDFFRGLSAESRYNRFMAPVGAPEALIESLVAVDHVRHLALLAVAAEGGREVMIGEARYVADASDAANCELAIAVADAWQGRGIGRALLERLLRQALSRGIRCMAAETLAGNRRMISLARRAGFAVRASREDRRLVILEKCLRADRPAAA